MKQQDVVSTTFVLRTVNSLGWSATMPFFAIYLDVVRRLALGSIGVVYLASGFATFLSQIFGRAFDRPLWRKACYAHGLRVFLHFLFLNWISDFHKVTCLHSRHSLPSFFAFSRFFEPRNFFFNRLAKRRAK